MKYPFRSVQPIRTCTTRKTNYREYKDNLVKDFNHHCGYTNCCDFWFGGKSNFQIDHFKPYSKYPKLESDYSNLVYCCSYVNRAKGNDDSPNYLDPCIVDYNKHFERDMDGQIIPITDKAAYMVQHLHLNLQRYSIIWMLEQLSLRMDKLDSYLISHNNSSSQEIKSIMVPLVLLYRRMEKTLMNNQ